jgi:hypothetical protein
MNVARAHPGVKIKAPSNSNAYDEASGTAVGVGTEVTVEAGSGRSEVKSNPMRCYALNEAGRD